MTQSKLMSNLTTLIQNDVETSAFPTTIAVNSDFARRWITESMADSHNLKSYYYVKDDIATSTCTQSPSDDSTIQPTYNSDFFDSIIKMAAAIDADQRKCMEIPMPAESRGWSDYGVEPTTGDEKSGSSFLINRAELYTMFDEEFTAEDNYTDKDEEQEVPTLSGFSDRVEQRLQWLERYVNELEGKVSKLEETNKQLQLVQALERQREAEQRIATYKTSNPAYEALKHAVYYGTDSGAVVQALTTSTSTARLLGAKQPVATGADLLARNPLYNPLYNNVTVGDSYK